ncbi:MAG: hypothetical protein LBQ18_01100 [Campylobacteraceae bacterium]|jgi:hypothetical protein|nr:hypothetical protein [Campylobacteraceae bacterium]
MKFKSGSLSERLAKRGKSITLLGRSVGFTTSEIALLGKFSNGTTRGKRNSITKRLLKTLQECDKDVDEVLREMEW